MPSEIAIAIHDEKILCKLANEDLLFLLIRKPQSKFYLDVSALGRVNFLAFARIREFVLDNFGQVEMIGEEDSSAFDERRTSIYALLSSHDALLDSKDVQRTMSAQVELIVLCLDVYEASAHISKHGPPIPAAKPPKIVTFPEFRRELVDAGHMYSAAPVKEWDWIVDHYGLKVKKAKEPNLKSGGVFRQLYDPVDFEEMRDQVHLQPNDVRVILQRNLDQLGSLGSDRKFASAPSVQALDNLQARFPNFAEVIDAIKRRTVLARLVGDSIAQLPPMLLLGEPGVGKTAFAKAFSETVQTNFFEIRMNSLTAGFAIGGSDMSWSNGRPGLLFNEIALKDIINPVCLLDELDKVPPGMSHDPRGHLYTLLERDTAKRFKDEAISIEMDLSHIIWIATANDATEIELPLLSRFTVFNIPPPTRSQARDIAKNIYCSLLEHEEWGKFFSKTLSDDTLDEIASASPREVRKLLFDALGSAAGDNRNELLVSDFDRCRAKSVRSQSIGFF
ncbi:AAA family ATPase [Collimonas sp.]|jgi:ATP-dependent Lon protease|uniref:AAA family ATPase n=1 Tax=Collimonas sp. TaxID=1963772 RepID=UPI002D028631|nr:AAA family ATPase [Collimonas sp.]HWW05646.1 AAA family ATPase [Collimonas sp.]